MFNCQLQSNFGALIIEIEFNFDQVDQIIGHRLMNSRTFFFSGSGHLAIFEDFYESLLIISSCWDLKFSWPLQLVHFFKDSWTSLGRFRRLFMNPPQFLGMLVDSCGDCVRDTTCNGFNEAQPAHLLQHLPIANRE